MSRIDENQELLSRAKLSFSGNPERVMCDIEAQKLGILMDISKSLAILADCCLDEWQKNEVSRFMSMTDEDKKLYSEYVEKDEATIIKTLKNLMPKQEENDGK